MSILECSSQSMPISTTFETDSVIQLHVVPVTEDQVTPQPLPESESRRSARQNKGQPPERLLQETQSRQERVQKIY